MNEVATINRTQREYSSAVKQARSCCSGSDPSDADQCA